MATADQAAQNQQPDKKPADKKRVEEEDDAAAKTQPKRKIRVEDEDPNPKPQQPAVGAAADFAQLAETAVHMTPCGYSIVSWPCHSIWSIHAIPPIPTA